MLLLGHFRHKPPSEFLFQYYSICGWCGARQQILLQILVYNNPIKYKKKCSYHKLKMQIYQLLGFKVVKITPDNLQTGNGGIKKCIFEPCRVHVPKRILQSKVMCKSLLYESACVTERASQMMIPRVFFVFMGENDWLKRHQPPEKLHQESLQDGHHLH